MGIDLLYVYGHIMGIALLYVYGHVMRIALRLWAY
jgi:hypothetical protein